MSSQTTTADHRAGIEAANHRFMEAFGRSDAASVSQLYTSTAQLLPAHSDFLAGTTAIQRFWQGAMDMGLKEAVLETLEIEAHGDMAYEVGRYTLKAGGGQVADAGKYLVIWKHEGGSWKLHRDIWTTSRSAA
jgi:ketosteroid isomerase-like protein